MLLQVLEHCGLGLKVLAHLDLGFEVLEHLDLGFKVCGPQTKTTTGRAPDLVEGDDGWLGAWWLGFVVVGGLTALVAPLLALFPQRLPGEEDTEVWKLLKKSITKMYIC